MFPWLSYLTVKLLKKLAPHIQQVSFCTRVKDIKWKLQLLSHESVLVSSFFLWYWQMGFQFAGKAVYTAVWVAAVSLFMKLLVLPRND
ncbi:hypothetical protein L1987_19032 [Smallanthus sonchifolius]|uniref:Uncharacterized protein n=1 Tax=Smallanthus sonchifolius TaxID=185202 RepID=A0ACB9J2E2_9ASTR|nr:hypothetical protein L1987_19032 [Smallanthus sonchifolius]